MFKWNKKVINDYMALHGLTEKERPELGNEPHRSNLKLAHQAVCEHKNWGKNWGDFTPRGRRCRDCEFLDLNTEVAGEVRKVGRPPKSQAPATSIIGRLEVAEKQIQNLQIEIQKLKDKCSNM